jgi:hypothetical protein
VADTTGSIICSWLGIPRCGVPWNRPVSAEKLEEITASSPVFVRNQGRAPKVFSTFYLFTKGSRVIRHTGPQSTEPTDKFCAAAQLAAPSVKELVKSFVKAKARSDQSPLFSARGMTNASSNARLCCQRKRTDVKKNKSDQLCFLQFFRSDAADVRDFPRCRSFKAESFCAHFLARKLRPFAAGHRPA